LEMKETKKKNKTKFLKYDLNTIWPGGKIKLSLRKFLTINKYLFDTFCENYK